MRCSSSRPAESRSSRTDAARPGHEDLLLALGERDDRDPGQVELAHRSERRGELALAAVDHDQVRERRERPVVALLLDQPVAGEAPAHRLGDRSEVVLSPLVADPELAVVRAARHGLLEHDHRRDALRLAQVRGVEALDAHRQHLEVERLAQLLERLCASCAGARGGERLVAQRELGVALGEPEHPALLAAHRDAHLDPRAATLREVVLEHLPILELARDDDERRDADLLGVVLGEERDDQLAGIPIADVLEVDRAPLVEPARANREELHVGQAVGDRDRDDVVGRAAGVDLLTLREGAQRR